MSSEVAIRTVDPVGCIVLPKNIASALKGESQHYTTTKHLLEETELDTQSAKFFHSQHEFGLFSVKLQKDTLTVLPLAINGYQNPKLTGLHFELPSRVINDCFTVTELNDNLIIDLILEVNVLITLSIPFNAFADGLTSKLNTWCNYQMPYAFDKRNPLFMYSVDYNQILVSTVDSGLLLLHRYNPLTEFKITSFTNNSYLSSIKSKFFGSSDLIKFNNLSVSLNSIIDIIMVSESVFITIDVNKIIKFWDLNFNSIIKEFNLNNSLDDSLHSAVLSPFFPNNILKFYDNKLHVLLSLDNYYISVFAIDEDYNLDLVDKIIFSNPSSYNPIDYVYENQHLHIVSVYSDTYFIQSHHKGKWSDAINVTKVKEIKNSEFLYRIEHNDTEYALKFIKNNFSNDIIQHAIGLIQPEATLESINTSANDWIRFASICTDLSNKDNKIYALTIDTGFLVLAKTAGFSVVKDLTKFEKMYFDESSDEGKLSNLFIDYAKGYESVHFEIEKILLSGNENVLNVLFNDYIFKISNEKVVTQLLQQLGEISSASDVIEHIAKFDTDFITSSASKFTSFNEQFMYEILINNCVLGKFTIFGLLLVLGTLDYSESVNTLFGELRELYKTMNLVELVDEKLVISFIKTYIPQLYFKNDKINTITTKLFDLLNTDEFRYYIACETGDSAIFEYLNDSKLTTLIKALVLLETGKYDESKEVFIQNPDLCYVELSKEELFTKYKSNMDLIQTKDESKYFYNVALIFEKESCLPQALEIAMKSMDTIESLKKVFQLSLKMKSYPIAFETLKLMKHEFRISALRSFIYKLLQENQFALVVEQDYIEDFDYVDEIIMGLANECEDIRLAKKYYRLIYSLRLKEGDFRGAVQSLYAYGVRQKDYDNFLVMLNLLKTLSETDRWFVHQGAVINEDLLRKEYAASV